MTTFNLNISLLPPENPKRWASSLARMISNPIGRVSLDATIEGSKGGLRVFNKTIAAQKQPSSVRELETLLKSKQVVPLLLKNVNSVEEARSLKPSEVVFVTTKELESFLDLSAIKNIQNQLRGNADSGSKLLNVHRKLTSKVSRAGQFGKIKQSLMQKLSDPINEHTREEADMFVEKTRLIEKKERFKNVFSANPTQLKLLEQSRMAGSNSIQPGGAEVTELERQKAATKEANWKKANNFIVNLAKSNSPLTIENLGIVNYILTDNGKKPKTEDELMENHHTIEDLEVSEFGQLRDSNNSTGGNGNPISYVEHSDVPMMVSEVLAKVNSDLAKNENPIVVAAQAYQALVSIHPFTDGNGRTCRLAMDYVLLRGGLLPASFDGDVTIAIFGDQASFISGSEGKQAEGKSKHEVMTTTRAIQKVLKAVKNSYNLVDPEQRRQRAFASNPEGLPRSDTFWFPWSSSNSSSSSSLSSSSSSLSSPTPAASSSLNTTESF